MSDRTRLVFVRHGRTAFNVEGRLQGRLDMPLDEVGRRQAFTVAQVIAAMEPDAIIASPLQRARDTAQAIGACAGLGVQLDDRLIEIDVGRWSGQRAADLRRNDPEYAAGVVSPIDYRRADGETASEVADRIVAVCQDVVAQYAGGTIILVAHGFACGPESAGCSAATMAPHDAWAVLITVHGRLLTTCRRTSSRLEGSFHHGVSWPITVVSRCPWTSILQRGHDPLKFYESPGDGRYLRLALRAGFWGIGAVGSALPWHGRGQGFESPMLHSS